MTKPPMPVADLVELICGDLSSDYCDGDHPGYVNATWDPATGELVMSYAPDEEVDPPYQSPYGATTRHFREITPSQDVRASD